MIRIIDARNGKDVSVGQWVIYGENTADAYRILAVNDNFTSATARIQMADGRVFDGPLTVRFMHPSFLFRRVAFVPS